MEQIHALAYSDGKLAFAYDNGNFAILEIDSGIVTKVAVEVKKIRNRIPPIADLDIRGNYLIILTF